MLNGLEVNQDHREVLDLDMVLHLVKHTIEGLVELGVLGLDLSGTLVFTLVRVTVELLGFLWRHP